jgi:hypothetical protein
VIRTYERNPFPAAKWVHCCCRLGDLNAASSNLCRCLAIPFKVDGSAEVESRMLRSLQLWITNFPFGSLCCVSVLCASLSKVSSIFVCHACGHGKTSPRVCGFVRDPAFESLGINAPSSSPDWLQWVITNLGRVSWLCSYASKGVNVLLEVWKYHTAKLITPKLRKVATEGQKQMYMSLFGDIFHNRAEARYHGLYWR